MVKHPDRQKHVRELNNAAKACGLQGIRDDVGRQAVLDFIQRVRQSAGPEPAKKDAESFGGQQFEGLLSNSIFTAR